MIDHGDIEKILQEIESNQQDAKVLLRGLTDAQFNWKPAQAVWSMAENLTHLSATTGPDLPELVRTVRQAKQDKLYATGPFRYGMLSRWFVSSREPPPKRRVKAPKMYAPPPHAPLDRALDGFLTQLEQLAELARESNGLDLARVKTKFPAVKFLKMSLGARFLLLTAHNRRHLWQAQQVKHLPQFPAA